MGAANDDLDAPVFRHGVEHVSALRSLRQLQIQRDEIDLGFIAKIGERLPTGARHEHGRESERRQAFLDFAGDPDFVLNH